MNYIPAYLFFVLATLGAVAFVLTMARSARKSAEILHFNFQHLAKRFEGEAFLDPLDHRPVLRFPHDGLEAVVSQSLGGDMERHAQFQIAWRDEGWVRRLDRMTRLRMVVRPEQAIAVGKWLGMSDIVIGDRQFDNRFHVSGNDEEAIRALMTPATRELIGEVWKIYYNNDICVTIQSGRMLVRKLGGFGRYERLERFIGLSLRLHDELQAAQRAANGVFFADWRKPSIETGLLLAQPFVDGEWLCQVCGEGPQAEDSPSEIVFCRSCQTPHHKDCWSYNGVCSTYGCGEHRYEEKRELKPARRPFGVL